MSGTGECERAGRCVGGTWEFATHAAGPGAGGCEVPRATNVVEGLSPRTVTPGIRHRNSCSCTPF